LPKGVRKVEIWVKGHGQIISPIDQTWDGFFLNGLRVFKDFLPEGEDL
jgi:antitoxin VapB